MLHAAPLMTSAEPHAASLNHWNWPRWPYNCVSGCKTYGIPLFKQYCCECRTVSTKIKALWKGQWPDLSQPTLFHPKNEHTLMTLAPLGSLPRWILFIAENVQKSLKLCVCDSQWLTQLYTHCWAAHWQEDPHSASNMVYTCCILKWLSPPNMRIKQH